ncbi:hypothetical protein BpHYR1_052291 [Brachionus plicatilis]|uniref:Uncharacterized protein n=1 Tax=Brachionus plicatilis TaxID=10195 RepID=A0A3M7RM61_BRAPC|nr:hypothetical protein BpHYR1_052291 [Brachionus plicatilis]
MVISLKLKKFTFFMQILPNKRINLINIFSIRIIFQTTRKFFFSLSRKKPAGVPSPTMLYPFKTKKFRLLLIKSNVFLSRFTKETLETES